MFRRKFKGEFDFLGLMGFIHSLFNDYGLGEIRFYPESHKELFTEIQLMHVAPSWDINNPNGFLFAWKRYEEMVRKVTFDQFSKHESKNRRVRVTIDLDEKYISLERSVGISSDQAEESLENNFGPNLIDSNQSKVIFPKKDAVRIKKTIGILNKGRFNKFLNNKFFGLDIGIQDEGEETFASGNEFSDSKSVPIIEKIEIIGRDKIEQHGEKNKALIENKNGKENGEEGLLSKFFWQIIIAIVAGLLIAYFAFRLGWNN